MHYKLIFITLGMLTSLGASCTERSTHYPHIADGAKAVIQAPSDWKHSYTLSRLEVSRLNNLLRHHPWPKAGYLAGGGPPALGVYGVSWEGEQGVEVLYIADTLTWSRHGKEIQLENTPLARSVDSRTKYFYLKALPENTTAVQAFGVAGEISMIIGMFPQLESLDLTNAYMLDSGDVNLLGTQSNLRELKFRRNLFNDKNVEYLKGRLPNCRLVVLE